MWLYHNAFQPVMRLQEKLAIPATTGSTSYVRRIHDQARTPLDRVIAAGVLLPEPQARLEALYAATNPRALHTDIYERLDYLMSLPCATSKCTEDVRLTLRCRPIIELAQSGGSLPMLQTEAPPGVG